MDLAAIAAGLSQVEIRRRNLIQPAAMPYRTPMGETFDSGNFPLILDRVLRAADWDGYAQRKAASEARGLLRGRALSTFLEWTGVVHQETVHLKVEDGRVRVYTAMQAMGQGIETSYLQILAETLDVDAERIEIVQGDSDIAQGIGSMGSRSLYIGGSAMFTASQQTIDAGRRLAGAALEAAPEDIQYRAGRFSVAGTDLGIDLFELAARQPDRRIAVDTLQKVGGPSWPNGAHVCELEVDPETGTTQVVRYTTVDDVGRVINPPIVAGQVQGGIAQALGQALLERVHYDADSGQLLSGSLMDYALPRADDLPMIDTLHRRVDALPHQSARRQGRGRTRHRRRHADDHQRIARRVAPARRDRYRDARHARARMARTAGSAGLAVNRSPRAARATAAPARRAPTPQCARRRPRSGGVPIRCTSSTAGSARCR